MLIKLFIHIFKPINNIMFVNSNGNMECKYLRCWRMSRLRSVDMTLDTQRTQRLSANHRPVLRSHDQY